MTVPALIFMLELEVMYLEDDAACEWCGVTHWHAGAEAERVRQEFEQDSMFLQQARCYYHTRSSAHGHVTRWCRLGTKSCRGYSASSRR